MKTSLVITIFNEERTIEALLNSIFQQTQQPDEIIIVDAYSTDKTLSIISNYAFSTSHFKCRIREKKGNRSVGRNEGIKNATGVIILVTDAGCTLDKNWVKYVTEPFVDKTIDVVAGYYEGIAKNVFQKCLIPYVLVMPDKAHGQTFLPATRSMAFTKSLWEKAGQFQEEFSHNEDYVFAKQLRKINAKIFFEKKAIVYWIPRNSFSEAFSMFYRFAYGDAESHILRPKVLFIFFRYIIGIALAVYAVRIQSAFLLNIMGLLVLGYLLWAIMKNYRYVNMLQGMYLLPALQLVSDIAIITGTTSGWLKRVIKKDKKEGK